MHAVKHVSPLFSTPVSHPQWNIDTPSRVVRCLPFVKLSLAVAHCSFSIFWPSNMLFAIPIHTKMHFVPTRAVPLSKNAYFCFLTCLLSSLGGSQMHFLACRHPFFAIPIQTKCVLCPYVLRHCQNSILFPSCLFWWFTIVFFGLPTCFLRFQFIRECILCPYVLLLSQNCPLLLLDMLLTCSPPNLEPRAQVFSRRSAL